MSLYGALFAGVSALNAQSQAMGMISDNIANVNTIGYKRSEAAFSSMVTAQTRATAYSPGAVRAQTQTRIDQQGILQQSRSSTDIAMSGNGFFVVQNSISDGLQEVFFTRAGQFSEDSQGYLVSPSGKYLLGWRVDQDGNIPAGSGDVGSLVPVDVAFLGSVTRPTTRAEVSINLDADETPYLYPLATPASQDSHFSRAVRVYDSLGEGQDVTMKFFHTTSPTATAAGVTNIAGVSNLMNTYAAMASTATLTSTVDIIPADTLADVAPGLALGDTFIIEMEGLSSTISLDPAWDATDLRDAINAVFPGAASVVADRIVINSDTPIQIRFGGSQPVTEANLNAIGLDFMTQPRDPRTFTIQVGALPAMTVTINDGDSAGDLVAKINALPDVNAQFDIGGNLVIAADQAGLNLIIDGVGGGGTELPVAGLTALGLSATTYPPPAAPSMLGPLDQTANPQNWWYVEFTGPTGLILTSGMLNFNGDGSVNVANDPSIISLGNIDWGNGSVAQSIDFDVSSLTQYAGTYNVVYTNQNGAELGLRTGVSVDSEGFVIARFSNGESSKLYKLPVATFANANGLIARNGNVFQESDESGEYNLREAGSGGAGVIESSTLEASNVDLADEFSKMIVTQRAYSAGTKVINTADQMLEELLRLR
jgi:flagellar hook protein FlgE